MSGMLQLLKLIHSCEEVGGRKKLQKIVHILKTCGHAEDFPQDFGYLHYGPFSAEVAAEVDQLTDGDSPLIHEVRPQGKFDPYRYRATEAAGDLLEKLCETDVPAWADRAVELNQRETLELEAISTVLYLQGNGFTGEKLESRFAKLKPSLAGRFDDALASSQSLRGGAAAE